MIEPRRVSFEDAAIIHQLVAVVVSVYAWLHLRFSQYFPRFHWAYPKGIFDSLDASCIICNEDGVHQWVDQWTGDWRLLSLVSHLRAATARSRLFSSPADLRQDQVLEIIDAHGCHAVKYSAPGLGPYSPSCLAQDLVSVSVPTEQSKSKLHNWIKRQL